MGSLLHIIFIFCIVYLFIFFVFVLSIVFAMDYPYLIPPVFDGTIKLCYANIQTSLMLMTTFFCSHRRRLITNSPHSHPFHQICISNAYTIHSTKTNKHTQCTVRRQTHIHNTQYENKQAYTIHSTRTSTHTQYTVKRQTHIHNT
jgi:hypothetical protein